MSAAIHYPHAPITEAIIDLRVTLAEGTDSAALRHAGEEMQSDFPACEQMLVTTGEMEVGPQGGSASVRQRPAGWKRTSSDRRQIVQIREDGFTFSRLAPYDRWEVFRTEARRVWDVYRERLQPQSIDRLAVRYINRIDVPGSQVDLKTYFRTFPEVAPELPQLLEGFFVQLRLPFPQLSARCLINQTIVPPPRAGIVSIVLDVDLFRSEDVPQDEAGVWEYVEKLHVEKNRIFESCITDASRLLFTSCRS